MKIPLPTYRLVLSALPIEYCPAVSSSLGGKYEILYNYDNNMCDATLYASPYLVATPQGYTKLFMPVASGC